jgi:hypothetical protein
MKYFTILLAMLFCISNISSAQVIEPDLLKKLKGKTKLTEIMKVVEKYYANENKNKQDNHENEPEENSYLHWKRWEWYMESRLDKDGNFVNINERLLNVIEEQKQNNQQREQQSADAAAGSTSAYWSLIGPTSVAGGNANQLSGIGRADRIAFHPTDPNTIYLGTPAGGLWKTTSGGTTWYPVAGFIPGLSVSGIVVDHQNPNIIYVLTGDGNASNTNTFTSIYGFTRPSAGLFKSTDGGLNFVRMPPLPTTTTNYFGYKLVQDPQFNNVLLAATTNGLFRSSDFGVTWTRPITYKVFDIEFKPNGFGTIYASTQYDVQVSSDYGSNFNTLSNFDIPLSTCDRIELAVTPNNQNVVYALAGKIDGAGSFRGVYKSTNSGINFTRQCNTPNILGRFTNGSDATQQNEYNLGIAVSPTNENNVLTCGLTVWRSTNAGSSFVFSTTYQENYATAAQYIHPDVHDVIFNPLNGWVYAASDGGFYRSTNNGVSWQDLSQGFATTQIYHMGGFNGNLTPISIACQDNGVRARKFGTGNFEAVWGGDGFDAAYCPANSGISYVTTNGGIQRALTNGNLSGTSPAGIAIFPPVATHPTDVNTVYTSGYGEVYKSTNAAANWTTFSSVSGSRSLTTCQANVNRVYAASAFNGVFRSDNGGTNWSTNLVAALSLNVVTDINVCPSNSDIVWITVGGFSANNKVFYSTNAGSTWQNLSGTLPNIPINCIYLDASNNAYIGTDVGVYYQANDKVDWTPYYNFLPKVAVTDIYETNGMLRASTFGRGVWECPIYSTCDADFTLSGDLSGQKFYQTSNTIITDVNIVGGAGTEVFFKAGNKITLSPGFKITEQNKLRAYLGPCDAGNVPVFRSSTNGKPTIPLFARMNLPKSETSQYPYGYLNIISTKNNSAIIKVNKIVSGNFEIKLVDKEGKSIELEKGVIDNEKGEANFDITLPNLNQNFYYLQLYYNETLIHFQELHIKS